jgi:cobalt-zinc-cadmium efflux system membrane fusion protein
VAERSNRGGGPLIGRLAAALLLTVALAGCDGEPARTQAPRPRLEDGRVVFPPASPQVAAIVAEPAQPGDFKSLRLGGRLAWDEERTARLYPAFAGRVVKILAQPGERVKAGQPLALLASPDFGQAQAEARKGAVDVALAEKTLARVRELVANGVAPQKELNAAEAELARARADAAQALGRVRLYGGGEAVDSALALRSPIDGTVVERNLNPGQELRPDASGSGAPPLFVVTDPTRLWVFLDATERDLGLLKLGEAVGLRTTAYPDDTFEARIVSIADFVDPATRTIRVRGIVANPERKLKGDLYVTGLVRSDLRAPVQIPARAAFLVGDQHYVFVEEAPGRYRRAKIVPSGETEGRIAVSAGLAAGERIVVDGALFLQRILAQLSARAQAEKG